MGAGGEEGTVTADGGGGGVGAGRNVPGGGDDGDVGAAGREALAQRVDTAQQEWGPRREGAPAFGGWTRAGDPQNSLGEAGRQLEAQRGVQEPRKGQSRGAHWAGRPELGPGTGRCARRGFEAAGGSCPHSPWRSRVKNGCGGAETPGRGRGAAWSLAPRPPPPPPRAHTFLST